MGCDALTLIFLVCEPSSSVDLCVQDDKSQHIAAMIYATLVNTQTHRELLTGYAISSARMSKR